MVVAGSCEQLPFQPMLASKGTGDIQTGGSGSKRLGSRPDSENDEVQSGAEASGVAVDNCGGTPTNSSSDPSGSRATITISDTACGGKSRLKIKPGVQR